MVPTARFGENVQVQTGRLFVVLLTIVAYFIALRAPQGIFDLAVQYAFSGYSALSPLLVAARGAMFMAPGVQHCAGGEGPWQVDYLSVIEQWVEGGKAPERLISSGRLEGGRTRTRPLCPYPQIATYTGQGSSDEAGSFVCKPPSTKH